MVNADRVDFSNRSRHAARAKNKRRHDFHREFFDLYELIAEITEAAVCQEHKQCALKDALQ